MSDEAPNHEVIYLLDVGDGWAWCAEPDPDYENRRPIKYIREDVSRNHYSPKLAEGAVIEIASTAASTTGS
jgi:hypothetical protein